MKKRELGVRWVGGAGGVGGGLGGGRGGIMRLCGRVTLEQEALLFGVERRMKGFGDLSP